MKRFYSIVKKHSLKLLGVAFAFVGALTITQLKLFWFYQPEVPEQLEK
jgi:cyclic lactone autoinducer peptide